MAVMDETAKKFLIKGLGDLEKLGERTAAAEATLGIIRYHSLVPPGA